MARAASVFRFAKRVYARMQKDDVFDGAAALGFYFTLALFPAMIFLMAIIPYLPVAHVDEAIMNFLAQVLPARATAVVGEVVREVVSTKRGSLLSVGLLISLVVRVDRNVRHHAAAQCGL